MRAVVFSGGSYKKSVLVKNVLQKAKLFIAADSGAMLAKKLGIIPHIIVGDFDSLPKKLRKFYQEKNVTLLPHPSEKDETDTELAIDCAIQKGATEIILLGGNSGDRFDHVIANLLLATTYSLQIALLDGNQISWIKKGPATIKIAGKKEDLLSLIPLQTDVTGLVSKNLYYPLKNETLFFGKPRGVSNVLTKNTAEISFTKGTLLIVHTHSFKNQAVD